MKILHIQSFRAACILLCMGILNTNTVLADVNNLDGVSHPSADKPEYDYVSFLEQLKLEKPGIYEFGENIYFVQEVKADGMRQEHVSQRLLLQASKHAVDWVSRENKKKYQNYFTNLKGKLGELVRQKQALFIDNQAIKFVGTGTMPYKQIDREIGRSVLVYNKTEIGEFLSDFQILDEQAARKQVWKQLLQEKNYQQIKEIAAETGNWDDYFVYSLLVDKSKGLFSTYPAYENDPIFISKLAIRDFQNKGEAAGLIRENNSTEVKGVALKNLPELWPRLLFSDKQEILDLLSKVQNSKKTPEGDEFVDLLIKSYQSSQQYGAYVQAREVSSLKRYYATSLGGYLSFSHKYSDQTNKYFKSSEQDFLAGRKDRLDQIEIGFSQSVETSPRHYKSWLYLGETCVVKEKWLDAIVAFRAALMIDNESIEARKGLLSSYKALGYINLAKTVGENILDRT